MVKKTAQSTPDICPHLTCILCGYNSDHLDETAMPWKHSSKGKKLYNLPQSENIQQILKKGSKAIKYYHYTVLPTLKEIIRSGEIKLSPFNLYKDEKAVVWLSSNKSWEQTVRKAFYHPDTGKQTPPLSRDALFNLGYPGIRIEINPAFLMIVPWAEHKRFGGLPKKFADSLELTGRKWGANPNEWFVCYKPIPFDEFRTNLVELWNGKEWVDITL